VLRKARISPDGQRLPHLLIQAELDGLITSGARRGKLHTYALLEERAPTARRLENAEAVAELTLRYFKSHGPAQLQDFVWWSGLTLGDARKGIAAAGTALEHQSIEGKDYWFDVDAGRAADSARVAHLLPNYDEYTVAYRDRAEILQAGRTHDPFFVLSNVVTIGGTIRGGWRRTPKRNGLHVEISSLDRFAPTEISAVEEAVRRLGRYLERPVHLSVRSPG